MEGKKIKRDRARDLYCRVQKRPRRDQVLFEVCIYKKHCYSFVIMLNYTSVAARISVSADI